MGDFEVSHGGIMMAARFLSFLNLGLFLLSFPRQSLQEQENVLDSRKPKLFYVTSFSTTTTISTTTICWKSTANGFSANACRKKRSLVLKNTEEVRRDEEISASKSLEGYGDPLLDSSIDKKLNEETERNARLDFSCRH